mgnify:CR=1 FL=1
MFEKLNISPELKKAISKLGFEHPTLIQEKALPLILEGKDLIGVSATGSGKTIAFGAGVLEKVNPKKGLQALILTPTRELAEQVKQVLVSLAIFKQIGITPVYGGVAMNPQIQQLQRTEVVVATPGRFKDHLQRGTVNTKNIKFFVLDEADRMLDMGFIDDIEFILKSCPQQIHTFLF